MKYLKEPTYTKYITGKIQRFNEDNNAFSRGAAGDRDKYSDMHEKSVENIEKMIPGKTILEHAHWVAGRTVDYQLRKSTVARDDGPIYNHKYRLKNPEPEALSAIIKDLARWLGADLVGIARLDRRWLYSHWGTPTGTCAPEYKAGEPIELPDDYEWVIVIIHEMDYENMQKTPAVEASTDIGYSRINATSGAIATYIRELGFRAIPAGNEIGLSIPMAVDAGLGELGRLGLLITREFGPRVRIGKVFTNLPLVPDKPVDLGIQKFCEECKLCAKHCIAGALTEGPRFDTGWDQSNNPGLLKWPVKAMKCFDWWVNNGTHCSVCIRVCPWNKPPGLLHKMVLPFAESGLFTKPILLLDKLFKFGRQRKDTWYSNFQDPSVIEVDDN